jgi:hypothetical protein
VSSPLDPQAASLAANERLLDEYLQSHQKDVRWKTDLEQVLLRPDNYIGFISIKASLVDLDNYVDDVLENPKSTTI